MPKLPIDYSNTIIYKLVHKEDYDNANIYIGSTSNFVKRKNAHKTVCCNEKSKVYNLKKYQYIRDNGGWDCFNMIEIEKFPCNDGNEARAREEYWRSHFNAQLNMVRAYITDVERKEYKKECYEQNKDHHNKNTKEYYKQHKDKILEKLSQQITCECGCIITQGRLTRHRKSQKHLMKIGVLKYEYIDDKSD